MAADGSRLDGRLLVALCLVLAGATDMHYVYSPLRGLVHVQGDE